MNNNESSPLELVRPKPKTQLPVCPHCLADPFLVSSVPAKVGHSHVVILFCGNDSCRKVFSVELVAIDPPAIIGLPGEVMRKFSS